MINPARIRLTPSAPDDFERILALRLVALRESLERLGRYDPERARARLAREFDTRYLRLIEVDGAFAGCVSLKPDGDGLTIEHFYVDLAFQNQGLGGIVMAMLLAEADAARKPVRLGVLKQSDANRFYQRHGFVETHQEDYDIYYLRPMGG
ncbi:MAG: GNAT family N-acetyltransferase [Phenylobacterium sp.]|nr:GNAT family N-acetyltransferase [Phenylobacterium sp.]